MMWCSHCGRNIKADRDHQKGFLSCPTCGKVLGEELFVRYLRRVRRTRGMKVVKRVALEGKISGISITEEASSASTKSRRTMAVTVGENCIVKSATDLSTNGDLHEAFELQIEPSQEAHDQSHLQQDVQSILVNRNSSSDNPQC